MEVYNGAYKDFSGRIMLGDKTRKIRKIVINISVVNITLIGRC